MRTARFVGPLLAFALLGACKSSHFDEVVNVAASKHPRECKAPFAVKQLNDWAYRVDACEGTLYYRCSFTRKTMGRTQCCDEVPDAATATAALGGPEPTSTCLDFPD